MRTLAESEYKMVAGGLMMADGDGGGGGGYGDDFPPIDVDLAPIDFGGLDCSFSFDSEISQIQVNVTVDDSYVQTAVMTPEVASTLGNLAQSACAAYAKKVGGQIACAGLGAAVGHYLGEWTTSRAGREQFYKGMEYSSKWGMLP